MKKIAAALKHILDSDTAVATVVVGGIYRGQAPIPEKNAEISTAISFELAAWPASDAVEGPLPSVRQQWIFQVDGDDSDAVDEATEATRAALHAYRGSVTTEVGTVQISRTTVDNVYGQFTGLPGYHQRFLEVTVVFRETA